MAANKPAPIACTLSPGEFKTRAAWIAQVTDTALMAYRIDGGTAHLLYRAEVKEAVEQLIRQEQACCGFLSFQMAETALGIQVNIAAPLLKAQQAYQILCPLTVQLQGFTPLQKWVRFG